MILVEVALQGAKGFPPLVRMGLKPGLNVWRCPDPALRAALVDATYHTLFPDPSRGSATAHLVGPERARIAVTFYGRDKITYRVVREADNGATKLYKFDAASNQYQLFTSVAQEVAQYIRVQQQIPDEVGYERLFMFSPATMPSRGLKARTRSGAPVTADLPRAPSAPGMFGAPPRMMSSTAGGTPPPRTTSGFGSSMNMTNALVLSELEKPGSIDLGIEPEPEGIEGKKQQLLEMRRDYEATLRAEKAQAEIDQLNARKFELSERTERLKKIEAERQRLVELYEKEQPLRSVPMGFAQRMERFEELEKKHEAERTRAHDELAATEEEARSLHVLGLERDPYFLGGIAGAVLMFGIAVAYSLPALAWINVLSMVVAAGGAFRYVGELERKHRLGIRARGARERLERLERQFGEDTRAAKELMRQLEIDSPQELLERLRGFEKLQGQIRVAEDAIRSMMGDPEMAAMRAEVEQIARRLEQLEPLVLGATSVISADTLAKRIRALEMELGPEALAVEQVRAAPPRESSYNFFPPVPLPRVDSVRTGDIPIVAPFTESGPTAPADPRQRTMSGGGHRRPPPVAIDDDDLGLDLSLDDDDEDGYGSGYGGTRGPRGGGAGFSGSGGMFAIGGSYGGPPGGFGGAGGYGGGYGDDAGGQEPDRSRDLFQIAVDLLAVDVDDLAQRIRTRFGQYLTAFTGKELREGTFGPRGELSVIGAGGEPVPYTQLPASSLDPVDAALRFTLIEACLQRVRVPVIFDDPFGDFSAKKRALLAQMIGYLGGSTQFFVLTDKSDIAGREVKIG